MITVLPDTVPAVTIPVPNPIDATEITDELHVPPAGASVKADVAPVHKVVPPVIIPGNGLTVNVAVTKQVEDAVYVIIAVPPGAIPVTIPVNKVTGAIAELLLLHVPPPIGLLNVDDCPTHMEVLPAIIPGIGLTIIVLVTWHPDGSE